jgi:hypothetical protein
MDVKKYRPGNGQAYGREGRKDFRIVEGDESGQT